MGKLQVFVGSNFKKRTPPPTSVVMLSSPKYVDSRCASRLVTEFSLVFFVNTVQVGYAEMSRLTSRTHFAHNVDSKRLLLFLLNLGEHGFLCKLWLWFAACERKYDKAY